MSSTDNKGSPGPLGGFAPRGEIKFLIVHLLIDIRV